jgi:hypothetical protein
MSESPGGKVRIMFFTAKIQARTAAIGAGVGHKPKIPAIEPAACVLLAKMRS